MTNVLEPLHANKESIIIYVFARDAYFNFYFLNLDGPRWQLM